MENIAHISETAERSAALSRRRAPVSGAVYGDIVQFVDFFLVTLASVGVAWFYHMEVLIVVFDLQRYATAGIIGATGIAAILRRDGYYEFDRLISSSRAMRGVLARWMMVVLGLIAFAFALKSTDGYSRYWLFAWAAVSAAALVSARVAAAAYLRRAVREGGVFSRRIAIVGASASASRFLENFQSGQSAISIAGVFVGDDAESSSEFNGPIAGDIEALEQAARRGDVDDIMIALPPSVESERVDALIRRLSILPVTIGILPDRAWLTHQGGEVSRIGGTPVLTLYRRPLDGWGGLIKNLEDRILGAICFVLAAPIMLGCIIALRLQGGGPIFFKQQRHGFNNEVFRIYKFRTMTVAEDGDQVVQARKSDARVTKVGAFLRKWSLDELPQLINVMRGEMSLIGPRPHALSHNHEYAKIIENYSGRHKVKPGITGWAQVNGFRGETSESQQMAGRVRYDLEYIDNWSLWFDMKILLLTVFAVLFPKNAH